MLRHGFRRQAAGVAAVVLLAGCAPGDQEVATDIADASSSTGTGGRTTSEDDPDDAPSSGPAGSGQPDTPSTRDDLGDGRCSGRVAGDRHDGDVVVPAGARCRLSGVVVRGSLEVGEAAVLVATGARLSGDLSAERHRAVSLRGTRIGGDLELERGAEVVLRGVRVEGDLECEDNRPPPDVSGTRVEGEREGQCAEP
jgi:hypothetical protein